MKSALIGQTGFVGSNLLAQRHFDAAFNSTTIDRIHGRSFDLLFCAGARAEKWKANRDPDADRAGIYRLMDSLETVRCERAILISTVDVFSAPLGVDEDAPVDRASATPYGRHRYELEQFFVDRFDTLIVRLPGLFGPGLKKNVVYDFLHGDNVDAIVATSMFQFYDLADLADDIDTALRSNLRLLHCATEPFSVAELARNVFDREFRNSPPGVVPAWYDLRSRHAELFGGLGGYLRSKTQVIDGLRRFVAAERLNAERRRCA